MNPLVLYAINCFYFWLSYAEIQWRKVRLALTPTPPPTPATVTIRAENGESVTLTLPPSCDESKFASLFFRAEGGAAIKDIVCGKITKRLTAMNDQIYNPHDDIATIFLDVEELDVYRTLYSKSDVKHLRQFHDTIFATHDDIIQSLKEHDQLDLGDHQYRLILFNKDMKEIGEITNREDFLICRNNDIFISH